MKLRHLPLLTLALFATSVQAFDLGGLVNKEQLGNLENAVQGKTQPAAANPSGLSGISNTDQIGSLKQALSQGAETAVANLAKENGYFGNDKVKIPLPDSLKKIEGLMRTVGMGRYADELTLSMNRAAEAAVPEAKALLIGAVKNMTVQDAKGILTGGNDAATQYFRKNTEAALTGKFKPIVSNSMQKVKLAEKYDQFAGKGVQYGVVDSKDAKLDDYITRRALDGLYLMMAEQEKAIRANPLEATGNLAKKVFSAIKL